MAGQLRLRRSGYLSATDGAAIMALIAKQLSDSQIDAVSAYFASHAPEPLEAHHP
jgi:cytochrome c553